MRDHEMKKLEEELRNAVDLYIRRIDGEVKEKFGCFWVVEGEVLVPFADLEDILRRHGEAMMDSLLHRSYTMIGNRQ